MPIEQVFPRPYKDNTRIGSLRVAFRVESPPVVRDSMGERQSGTWVKQFDTRGALKPMRGAMFTEGKDLNSELTHRITIRHRSGIDTTMRVVRIRDGQVFSIRSILDVADKHRWLHLTCQEQPIGAT